MQNTELQYTDKAAFAREKAKYISFFSDCVYGRVPSGWSITPEPEDQTAYPQLGATRICSAVTIHGTNADVSIPYYLWLPESEQPVPVVILICCHSHTQKPAPAPSPELMQQAYELMHQLLGDERFARVQAAPSPRSPSVIALDADTEQEYWPVHWLLNNGYAACAFYAEDAAVDSAQTWCECGLPYAFGVQSDAPSFGCLSAWAFAASRVLDALYRNPHIDCSRVSVAGHSRGGKAALWCAVQDERFATAFVNESGCCGAALNRGKCGESTASIYEWMPHWFCAGFADYASLPVEDQPFDQHMLLAAMAPRPIYVASASEDFWSDPQAEFAACVAASPAYTACDLPGLLCDRFPQPDTSYPDGFIGYHLRQGGHDLTLWDWKKFVEFEQQHFADTSAAT